MLNYALNMPLFVEENNIEINLTKETKTKEKQSELKIKTDIFQRISMIKFPATVVK